MNIAISMQTDPMIMGNYGTCKHRCQVHDGDASVELTLGPNLSDSIPAAGAKKKMQKMANEPSHDILKADSPRRTSET